MDTFTHYLRRHHSRRSSSAVVWLALLAVMAATLGCQPPEPSSSPPPPEPPAGTPKLAVLLVVDQCRADYLDRYRPYLSGGLEKLLDEGINFADTHHRHANTSTAPGHATIATGSHPSHHGIIGNGWLDRSSGDEVAAVDDDEHDKSPRRLLTTSLGDWLKDSYPNARVFTVGGKDRGAIFLGGKAADAAFWYDRDLGAFSSSDYYPAHQPPWLREANESLNPERWFGSSWQPLPETLIAASELGMKPPDRGLFPDSFPHALGPAYPAPRESYYRSLFDSPMVDELTLQFASTLIERENLGGDSTPDYLGINLAALDTVGHDYGPESLESLDTLLRLDRALGVFLEDLDTAVGLDNMIVSLSSDHGVAPLPELHQSPRHHRREEAPLRFGAEEIACAQRTWHAVREAFGPQEWFMSSFYLDRDLMEGEGVDPLQVEAAARTSLEGCAGIARVWTRGELQGEALSGPSQEPFFEAYRNAFHPTRSPDLLIQVTPYTLTQGGSGTNHGSAYEYDTHVPWLLRLPGKGAGTRVDDPVSTVDIAPTIAGLLGIRAPETVDGEDRGPSLP